MKGSDDGGPRHVRRRFGRLGTIVGSLGLACSCESAERSIHPVQGQVVVNGQPAENAYVVFHRKEIAGGEPCFPRGRTDRQGMFQLSTYRRGDGAPAGEYAVTIEWRGPPVSSDPDQSHPDEFARRPDRLGGQYRDPRLSNLRAVVTAGSNEVGVFQLEQVDAVGTKQRHAGRTK